MRFCVVAVFFRSALFTILLIVTVVLIVALITIAILVITVSPSSMSHDCAFAGASWIFFQVLKR